MEFVMFFIWPVAFAFSAGLVDSILRRALIASFLWSFVLFSVTHYRAYNLPTSQARLSTYVILTFLYSCAILGFVVLGAKLRQRLWPGEGSDANSRQ